MGTSLDSWQTGTRRNSDHETTMNNRNVFLKVFAFTLASLLVPSANAAESISADEALATLDPLFEKFMQENHVPGRVYGVVVGGKLVRVKSLGVQELKSHTPVTPDTVFRIASMSKQMAALTTLKLRDAGKLSLDAPAETYIPELRGFRYPTTDSPRITVRDLLSHGAGFVTDDPWGDRQLDMSEADFTRLLEHGVPFSRAPGMAYEYSNFGYALVGRLITNTSKTNYADYVTASLIVPLRMSSTSYDIAKAPTGKRAIGYRWENEAWLEEPALGPGAFGAMGGLTTTANDYARYVGWLLGAWPPRDGAEDGILRRASVREIARPANYAVLAAALEPDGCPRTVSYGYGVIPSHDCLLGFHFTHSGGLPGFGSNVLFLPNRGMGVFAFANRTYAPAARVVREAANTLVRSGAFPERMAHPGNALQTMAAAVFRIYESGDVLSVRESLAMNFLQDRSAPLRNRELADLKQKLGACKPGAPAGSDTAMSAKLAMACERGVLKANLILAPTSPATLQTLEFTAQN
jgi:CubicO group peptidase (beta-lactamase class C family)